MKISLYNKIFFIFISVIVISISIVSWYGVKSASDAYIDNANELSKQSTDALNLEIIEKLAPITKDVLYITNLYSLNRFLIWKDIGEDRKTIEHKQVFTNSIKAFLKTKKNYLKVRIITLNGDELINIKYDELTHRVNVLSDIELQNKKGRDYVEVTKTLKKGSFHISSMNLNMEYGEVSKPHKPVLRYSTPIININGERIGIIVVSYYAHYLLDILDRQTKINELKNLSYYLLDKDGNYLYNKDESKRWSAQLKSDVNFNIEHFNLIDKIGTTKSGVFMNNEKIYSYNKVIPLKENKENYFYVISSIDRDIALSKLDDFIYVFIIMLLSILIISFFVVKIFILKITTPITSVTKQLKALSKGEIKKFDIEYNGDDEVGEIVKASSKLIDAIDMTINQANLVANGDYSKKIKLLGSNDKLGIAIQNMTDRLEYIADLSKEISHGNYDVNIEVKSSTDKLGNSLNDMIMYLKDISNVATLISVGNLGSELKIRGSNDKLGFALIAMIEYLQMILNQAKSVSELDFSSTIQPKSENDKLSISIVEMTNILKEHKINSDDSLWFSNGVSSFNEVITGINDSKKMAKESIKTACSYIGAVSGVLYHYNEKNELLNLKASYAFLSENGEYDHFILGEGIIGEVASQKNSILLKDLDESTYIIKTGTQSFKPLSIYVFPIIHEGNLLGVMECASSKIISSLEQSYLDRVASIYAAQINANKQNNIIQELLDKSKKAFEELQVSSEEIQESNVQMEEQQQQLTLQAKDMKIKNEELLNAKEEIDKKADALEKSSQYKTEFLANMSHELRTPLNSIILLSKLLCENQSSNLNDKDIEKSQVIYKAGNDLLLLINDILDISKIESGNMALEEEEVHSSDIVEELNGLFSYVAQEKNVLFELNDDFNDMFISDKIKLLQIIKNLISNALKFTKKGKVSVLITQEKENLLISISDTGRGIPKEKLSLIFEAFKQVDGSISREYGGTGLGLSITKTFVDLMNGVIKVESEENIGSTFSIYIPLNKTKNEIVQKLEKPITEFEVMDEVKSEKAVSIVNNIAMSDNDIVFDSDLFDEKNILIVDDDSRNIFTLSSALQELGAETFSALNGDEAFNLLVQEEESMHVILMDLMMPVMDGLEAIKKIKNDERFKHIPIIAITAKTMKEDKELCFEAGANDYLSKPVNHNALISMLKAWSS